MRCEGQKTGWVELYAFDDRNIPEYYDPRIKRAWPFYGLQEVKTINISLNIAHEKIIKICKENSRSEKFVLIDCYKNIPDNFVKTLVDYCDKGKQKILNYVIYNQ